MQPQKAKNYKTKVRDVPGIPSNKLGKEAPAIVCRRMYHNLSAAFRRMTEAYFNYINMVKYVGTEYLHAESIEKFKQKFLIAGGHVEKWLQEGNADYMKGNKRLLQLFDAHLHLWAEWLELAGRTNVESKEAGIEAGA
jgi:hypothetical protein